MSFCKGSNLDLMCIVAVAFMQQAKLTFEILRVIIINNNTSWKAEINAHMAFANGACILATQENAE